MLAREKFRKLLSEDNIIVAPGAFDAWSAKLVEYTGFECVYMTGYGVSASVLGKPDIGYITQTEMVNQLRNIVSAVNIPVIADADNGFGGLLNVIRTVELYEQAGVAAIQLEDQVTPKRCGHMEGKEIISEPEMVSRIKSAIHARKDPNLVIIARTDARAVNGFEDAIHRAKSYEQAGADVIFVEAPQTIEEMKSICLNIKSPNLANMVEMGKTPILTGEELKKLGYKIVIYPASTLFASTKAILDLLNHIKSNDTTNDVIKNMVSFDEFNKMIKLNELRELETSLDK